MITMLDLEVGDKAVIKKVKTKNSAIGQRLLDMGITRGAEFLVERKAPLGDPIEIFVKKYHLALRKTEAIDIFVEKVEV